MNAVYVFSSSSDSLELNPLQQDVKPVVACCGCLTTERPLRFLDHKMADEFRLLLSPILACDSFLWYMCSFCHALLLKFRSFREKCLLAQNALSKNQDVGSMNTYTLDLVKSNRLQIAKVEYISIDPSFAIIPREDNKFEIKHENSQETGEDFLIDEDYTDLADETIDVKSLQFEDKKSAIEIMIEPLIDEQNALNEIPSLEKSNSSRDDGFSSGKVKASKSEDKHKKDNQVQKCPTNPQIVKDKIFGKLISKVRKKKDKIQEEKQLSQVLKIKKVRITKEEQKQEILKRKDNPKYVSSRYKCNLCYLRFQNKITFNNHMEKHQQKAGHVQCDICFVYVPKKELNRHMTTLHTYNYLCGQCGHIDKRLSSAKNHYLWHKGVEYKCKICGDPYDKKTTLQSHMRYKHGNTMINCSICNKLCNGDHGLHCHMKKSHKEAVGAKCESCKIQFHSFDAMRRHQPQGICDQNTRPCAACGEGFPSEELLVKHQSKCRTLQNPGIYRCEICGQVFDCKYKYKNHRVQSHQLPYSKGMKRGQMELPSSFMCELCGFITQNKSTMTDHKRRRHADSLKHYKCDYCQKQIARKQFLIEHIMAHMHTSMKIPLNPCRYCNKEFLTKGNMRRHERTNHENKYKFNCDDCGATFTTKDAMLNHKRHTHEGLPWPKRERKRRN